jgi:hypothetical protein
MWVLRRTHRLPCCTQRRQLQQPRGQRRRQGALLALARRHSLRGSVPRVLAQQGSC